MPNLYGLLDGGWGCWHTGKQHLSYAPPLKPRPGSVHWVMSVNTYVPMLAARGHRSPGGARLLAPHPPLDIPEPWYSMVRNIEPPRNVGAWSHGQCPLQLYNLPGFIGAHYSRDDWREVWRVYAGLVRLFDHCMGQIVTALKAQDIYDETLILLTSDHGEMLGSHRLWQKMCMYEDAISTPLMMKLPGGTGAGMDDRPGSHNDVLPTLLRP